MTKTKSQNIRILVVDDEPMMSDSLRQHLVEEGYAVDTAASGASDWRMAGGNGIGTWQ